MNDANREYLDDLKRGADLSAREVALAGILPVTRELGRAVAAQDAAAMRLRHIEKLPHHTVTLDGLNITCAYSVDGQYHPATESDPAEYPCLGIEAIQFANSGHWLSTADKNSWLERLPDLVEILEDEVCGVY